MKLHNAIRVADTGYALVALGVLLTAAGFMSWLEFGAWNVVLTVGAASAGVCLGLGFALAEWGHRAQKRALEGLHDPPLA